MFCSIRKAVAFILFAALLSACTRSPDHFSSDIAISLDGGPEITRHVEWSCSYLSNYSPFNMSGRTHVIIESPQSVESFLTLADGREVFIRPAALPHDVSDKKCIPLGPADWEAYVIDSRPGRSRLYHIHSGEAQKHSPGYDLPVLSVRMLKTASQHNPSDEEARLARANFVKKVRKISRLVVEEINYFSATGEPNQEHPDDVRFLLSLPADRPTVLLPQFALEEPIYGRLDPPDWVYEGLPHLRYGPSWGISMNLLPNANGQPIPFDIDRAITLYDQAGNVNKTAEFINNNEIFLLGDFQAPVIQASGVEKPIRIAASAVIWYPDRKRLFLITWKDLSEVGQEFMLRGELAGEGRG